MALLEVQSITKKFGGLVAVNKLDLSLNAGEILGMIGPNGAGKTTAFNVIAGYYKPDQGKVIFNGEDITHLRTDVVCQRGLARTFQIVKPFPDLSLLDNVMVGAFIRTGSAKIAKKKAEEILDFMDMNAMKDQYGGSLPVALRKRLEIAKALATEPRVLLLDEVMAGLRPTETAETIELVRKISRMGIGIIIVEHVMRVIMSLADRIVVLHHGEKIADGFPAEVTSNQDVIKAYLGEGKHNATNN